MSTQKERLLQFRDYLNMSTRAFELSIGLSPSTIAHAGDNLSANILGKTCSKYPTLNKYWLLTGDGEMLIVAKQVDLSTNKQVNNGCENVTGSWTSADYQERISSLEAQVERLQRQLDEERADRRKAEERVDKLLSMLSNG